MRVRRHEAGQAAVFVVVATAVLFMVLSAALVDVGGRMIDRTRAQSAADAAALASLAGGRSAAVRLAGAHGATVVAWTVGPDDEVTVVVRVGEMTATARATDAP